jgi:membrane protein DedA with SNARE-associated domain
VSDVLQQIILWAEAIIVGLGYPGIVLIMFLETVFPPIPSEVVMPFAGFLAARGSFNIIGVVVAGTLGAAAGATVLYGLAAWAEDHVVVGLIRRFGKWLTVSEDDLNRSLHLFDQHGAAAVFFGRLVPGVRSLISLPAGMSKMKLARFLAFTAFGSAIWNVLLAGSGYLLGDNWAQVEVWLLNVERVLGVVVAIAGVWVVIWFIRRVRARSRA